METEKVILLNSDYSFINFITWKRAVRLMVKGKVEVIKESNKFIENAEKTYNLIIPKVLRLVKLIRSIYRSKVPFSKKNIFVRDKFVCQYCGKVTNKPTMDHVIPKAQGGKSSFENCVCACKPCNGKKDRYTPREAKMFLKKQPYTPTIMEFIRIRMDALGIHDMLKEMGVY